MSFSNPTALLWAIAAVPIVLFYLLKIRLRKVPVGTTMFWEHVFDEKQPRAIWRQLRHLTSLLLQLALLALLVLALADPVWTSAVQQQRRLVVIVDTSASMQAVNAAGVSAQQRAHQQVEQLIAGLRTSDQMALIAAGSELEVACGLSSHPRMLQTALDTISPSDGPDRIPDAVQLGRRLLADHPQSRIIVVTDGMAASAEPSPFGKDVSQVLVGEPLGNVALTEFEVRRSLQDPVGYQILLQVSNFRNQIAYVTVELSLNNALLDVVPLELQPGQVHREVIEKTTTAGGILTAQLQFEGSDEDDALTVDNTAFAVLPARQANPVTLVTDGNWFLQHALEACDLVELKVTTELPPSVPKNAVLVLDGNVPPVVPQGNVLVVSPRSSTDLWQVTGTLQQPLAGTQADDSPLLQHVRLDNVLMPEAVQLKPTAEHESLINSVSEAPLYLRFPRSTGDTLVLNVDLNQGDLPLRTAFPILLTNAMIWFAGDDVTFARSTHTGEPSALKKPAALESHTLRLKSPTGQTQIASVSGNRVILPPLPEAGVWTLQPIQDSADTWETRFACNLANPQESDLRQPITVSPSDVAEQPTVGRPLWFYALIGAVCLLITEWFLFQRRWIQ